MFLILYVFSIRRFVPFGVFHSTISMILIFYVFTIQTFVPFDFLSHWAFFPFNISSNRRFLLFDHLSQSTFFPFDVLSQSAFFPFYVFSHSVFCLSTFCPSTFFTVGVFYFGILSVNPSQDRWLLQCCLSGFFSASLSCPAYIAASFQFPTVELQPCPEAIQPLLPDPSSLYGLVKRSLGSFAQTPISVPFTICAMLTTLLLLYSTSSPSSLSWP
jgi:hypothetical protein